MPVSTLTLSLWVFLNRKKGKESFNLDVGGISGVGRFLFIPPELGNPRISLGGYIMYEHGALKHIFFTRIV